MKDLLLMSNGHGEDMIACRVLDEIVRRRSGIAVEAWPMVGHGDDYRARGIATCGAPNLLPSAGFATMEWRLMRGDLRAGWVRTYWNQFRDALRLGGRYRLLVAVGDIVPLAAGALSRAPFMFIGCAKSSYYGRGYGYNRLEKMLMRRHALATFPRDALTARRLAAERIRVRDLGNPMMDGLEGSGDRLGMAEDMLVIGMLPGTREDAEVNFVDLVAAADAIARRHGDPARLRFVFPVRAAFDPVALAAQPGLPGVVLETGGGGQGVVLRIGLAGGAEAVAAKGRFADSLRMSAVVVGMAGTANEQAVGLGIPLVTVPARGIQGERYVRMKMQFFGESAVAVPREPDAIAPAVLSILADPARAARMGAAGRERMGPSGASAAIAAEIVAALDTPGAAGAGA